MQVADNIDMERLRGDVHDILRGRLDVHGCDNSGIATVFIEMLTAATTLAVAAQMPMEVMDEAMRGLYARMKQIADREDDEQHAKMEEE